MDSLVSGLTTLEVPTLMTPPATPSLGAVRSSSTIGPEQVWERIDHRLLGWTDSAVGEEVNPPELEPLGESLELPLGTASTLTVSSSVDDMEISTFHGINCFSASMALRISVRYWGTEPLDQCWIG